MTFLTTYTFIEDFAGIETLLVGHSYASAWYDDSTDVVPVTNTIYNNKGVRGKLVRNCTLAATDMCAIRLRGIATTVPRDDVSDRVLQQLKIGR